MKNVNKILVWLMAFLPVSVFAQDVEMADALHENGKIYVVVGVIAIIFIGLIVYLISIDRRLTKMESEIEPKATPSSGKLKFKANIELDVDESKLK